MRGWEAGDVFAVWEAVRRLGFLLFFFLIFMMGGSPEEVCKVQRGPKSGLQTAKESGQNIVDPKTTVEFGNNIGNRSLIFKIRDLAKAC